MVLFLRWLRCSNLSMPVLTLQDKPQSGEKRGKASFKEFSYDLGAA
jgi:hypothetical protein